MAGICAIFGLLFFCTTPAKAHARQPFVVPPDAAGNARPHERAGAGRGAGGVGAHAVPRCGPAQRCRRAHLCRARAPRGFCAVARREDHAHGPHAVGGAGRVPERPARPCAGPGPGRRCGGGAPEAAGRAARRLARRRAAREHPSAPGPGGLVPRERPHAAPAHRGGRRVERPPDHPALRGLGAHGRAHREPAGPGAESGRVVPGGFAYGSRCARAAHLPGVEHPRGHGARPTGQAPRTL